MAVGLADSQVSMSIKLQPKQASNTKIMNQAVAIIQWVDFYSGDAEPKKHQQLLGYSIREED